MNILFCSVGRRCELLKDFKKSLGEEVTIVVTDNSPYAPALAFADISYQVPLIYDESYIPELIEICVREKINVMTTLIDPEIAILAQHRGKFEQLGVEVLVPFLDTARLCYDKYKMFCYLKEKEIPTVITYGSLQEFQTAYECGKITLPVFVKPRTGSGSVGARKIDTLKLLEEVMAEDETLIIQELMTGTDMDADVYVDTVSHKPVAVFSKKKISTTIGGANKTVSFKDEKLFDFVKKVLEVFEFHGPLDMDLFFKDGQYYLSEINPRFGGAYLHAYGAGVDFPKLIYQNVKHMENAEQIGEYQEDIVMMMYDSVVVKSMNEIQGKMKSIP